MILNSACKITTGTYNLQSVTLNFKPYGILIAGTASCAGFCVAALNSLVAFSVKTQSSDHFKISSISELINKKSKHEIKR